MSCPKGTMLWTHRAIALAVLLLIISICLIIVPIVDVYKKRNNDPAQQQLMWKDISKYIISGAVLLAIAIILLIGSQVNAIYRGCWKTAAIIFIFTGL